MDVKITKGSTLTLRIDECEHSGDIERALADLPRGSFRVVTERVCHGPEVGFVAVKVTDGRAFKAGLAKADFASFSGAGNVVEDRVAEEEGMHAHEYGDEGDDEGGW